MVEDLHEIQTIAQENKMNPTNLALIMTPGYITKLIVVA